VVCVCLWGNGVHKWGGFFPRSCAALTTPKNPTLSTLSLISPSLCLFRTLSLSEAFEVTAIELRSGVAVFSHVFFPCI